MADRKPQLVIFDCDGVLVDSEPIAARVLAELVSELGYPLTTDEALGRFTGLSLGSVIAEIEAAWGRRLPADFRTTLRARDLVAFETELKPVAGVSAMLPRLDGKRCVASSGAIDKMTCTLGVTGLLGAFKPHLFSAEMVPQGKPAPDLFLYAAAAMGTTPDQAVVVEDSIAGIEAARAAGIPALGFAGASHAGPEHGARLAAAGAAVVFSDMATLPDLLGDVR